MDILTLLFALATFIAVVLFIEGGYLWWASTHSTEVKRLNRRLEEVSTGTQSARPTSLYKELSATD
jgi:tight adherence protein B